MPAAMPTKLMVVAAGEGSPAAARSAAPPARRADALGIDSGASAKPTIPAVPTNSPNRMRTKFQHDQVQRAVHQQARRQHEQERQDERAPADQTGDPAGGPAVGARDIGGGIGRERHRRRDHRQHAVVHDEHVRGHRRDAELDQRRRQQRRGQDIDAHRRQADAEHEGEHGDQQQQQEHVLAGQRQAAASSCRRRGRKCS